MTAPEPDRTAAHVELAAALIVLHDEVCGCIEPGNPSKCIQAGTFAALDALVAERDQLREALRTITQTDWDANEGITPFQYEQRIHHIAAVLGAVAPPPPPPPQTMPCPACRGVGDTHGHRCHRCRGTGDVLKPLGAAVAALVQKEPND